MRSTGVSPVTSADSRSLSKRWSSVSTTAIMRASRVPKWYWTAPQLTFARRAISLVLER